jgi:diadenosine tetraphosphate (Ap4A) HIT family hydrolase
MTTPETGARTNAPRISSCLECAVTAPDSGHQPAGGRLFSDATFVVHSVLGGSPLRGWMVVAPRRHVERLIDLDPEEQRRLFELAALVDRGLRTTLGAEKVYLAIFAEVVPHLHLHVIPRYADTPADLRGPRCFLAGPERHLPPAELAAATRRLAAAFATLEVR